jgi:hypothetical protein
MPRASPVFGAARTLWAMFLLLGLMYSISLVLRLPLFRRSLEFKKRGHPLIRRRQGKRRKGLDCPAQLKVIPCSPYSALLSLNAVWEFQTSALEPEPNVTSADSFPFRWVVIEVEQLRHVADGPCCDDPNHGFDKAMEGVVPRLRTVIKQDDATDIARYTCPLA